jgi:hypothetical protein
MSLLNVPSLCPNIKIRLFVVDVIVFVVCFFSTLIGFSVVMRIDMFTP